MTMADDLTNRGPADRKRISLTEEHEVRYWTKALGISESRLREVVAEVGHMAADVRKYLGL
jgi:hypothetical protein